MDDDARSLLIATTLSLRSMPTERANFLCPYRGPISYDSLRIDEATEAVEEATRGRSQRRKLRVDAVASKPEIDLLAALWFYGEKPELQYQVGRYDLDFYITDYRAAIEVDGAGYHTPDANERRDAWLLARDIYTVRIAASHVYKDPLWSARYVTKTIFDYRFDNPIGKE